MVIRVNDPWAKWCLNQFLKWLVVHRRLVRHSIIKWSLGFLSLWNETAANIIAIESTGIVDVEIFQSIVVSHGSLLASTVNWSTCIAPYLFTLLNLLFEKLVAESEIDSLGMVPHKGALQPHVNDSEFLVVARFVDIVEDELLELCHRLWGQIGLFWVKN